MSARKQRKEAWIIVSVFVVSLTLAIVLPSWIQWLFFTIAIISFYIFFDHIGSMATGIFREGDCDPDPPPPKRENKDSEKKKNLVGSIGIAVTKIMPSGKGEIDGEIYDCSSGHALEKGDHFKVLDLSFGSLKIERFEPSVSGNEG